MGTPLSCSASAGADLKPGVSLDLAALRRRMAARLAPLPPAEDLLPVCSWCRKVRDAAGAWAPAEWDLLEEAGRPLTHGVCPDCAQEFLSRLRPARLRSPGSR